jgi:hypothetical protein
LGEQNDAMCSYLSEPDIFADYWNGILFGGREEIRPEELEAYDGNYYGIAGRRPDEKTKPRRRDVVKRLRNGGTYIILGVEDQQEISYPMPVRHLEYDAMEYGRQLQEIVRRNRAEEARRKAAGQPSLWADRAEFLSGFRKEDRLMPVITTVFYHGEAEYDGCRDLHGMLHWTKEQEKYKSFVANYPLRLVTLKEIQEECFRTGLRELVGVMKRSGDREKLLQYWEENRERFDGLDDETIETMGILIHQPDLKNYRKEKGGLDMCKAFEDVKQEGKREGKLEGKADDIQLLLEELGPVPEKLCQRVRQERDEGTLRKWLKLAARAATVQEFARQIEG